MNKRERIKLYDYVKKMKMRKILTYYTNPLINKEKQRAKASINVPTIKRV